MRQMQYIMTELLKSYHVFCKYDTAKAAETLKRINDYRLSMALIAEQRQIFIEQLNVAANASGYKEDVFFSHDDIDSLVQKFIAYLTQDTTISLIQQGTRELMFTRQDVQWQQLFSDVQLGANLGQKIPFDLPQEIYLQKSQTLDIGVIGNTSAGFLFVHGCNLKDDAAPNREALTAEINRLNFDGTPSLPEPALVPIQFQFESATVDTPATAPGGGDQIFSIKSERSVLLTEVSTTSLLSRITLIDKGRDQLICDAVESAGVAGSYTNQYTGYYPLPYPHLLRANDRIQLKAVNGSNITNTRELANSQHTFCFRGWTI